MKRKYICLILLVVLSSACSENHAFNSSDLSFNIPEEVIREEDLPEFDSYKDRFSFIDGKYILRVLSYSLENTPSDSGLSKYIIESNNHNDLEDVLENKSYIFWGRNQYATISSSYEKLFIDEEIVGEKYIEYSYDGLLYPRGFSYVANFISTNNVYMLELAYNDISDQIPPLYKDFFYLSNGEWYWKDKDSIYNFYNEVINTDLSSNDLEKLNEIWNEILDSIILK